MPFIPRADLPQTLWAAYDKAAKGVENDETRTNDKNDESKIDSKRELLIFQQEVENMYSSSNLDKLTYPTTKNTKKEGQDLPLFYINPSQRTNRPKSSTSQ